MRILVIEDNPANLELMTYLLRAHGFELLTARDGLEGLALARSARPDAIVSDVQMPGADGYEIARRLKADVELRRIPLIAVTALAMIGDKDRMLNAGFDGYIDKPINAREFGKQVAAFIPVSSGGKP